MTLRDYAAVVRRRKWFVILPTLVVTIVALGLTLAQPKRYAAEADVLVKQPPTAGSVGGAAYPMDSRTLQNELQRAKGSAMQDEVRTTIGNEPTLSVRLAVEENADVMVFRAESSDPQAAADAANAYAQEFIDQRRAAITADFQTQADVMQTQLDALDDLEPGLSEEQRAELAITRTQYEAGLESIRTSISLAETSGASVIDAAQPPGSPFEPNPERTVVLAAVVGLLIGLGAAFLVDYLDTSLRDEEGLARASGLPVLAVIPRLKDWPTTETHVVAREQPTSPPAEAYRALRTSIQFLGIDQPMQVIQVTSPKPGDGKTTTATNLAVTCARAGLKVVLVDCDLRRPRVHTFFDLPNDQGFTSAMLGAKLAEVAQKIDGEPNLAVVSSGPPPPDPSELLAGVRAKEFIENLRRHADLVIVDSPPVLVVADPLEVSGYVDGVLLVASAKSTDRRQVARAAEQLAQIEAPVIGAVLNSFDLDKAGSGYEYRYAYGRYETSNA